jgi:uncharacterized protein (DUF885 family)
MWTNAYIYSKVSSMRFILLLCAVLLTGLLPGQSKADDQLQSVIDRYHDHRGPTAGKVWPTWTEEEGEAEMDFLSGVLEDLNELDESAMTEQNQINLDLLRLRTSNDLFQLEFGAHTFPLDSEGGFLAGIIYGTVNRRVRNEDTWKAYQTRLQQLPVYFKWRQTQMEKGMMAGKLSPKLIVQNCADQIDRMLALPPEKTMFFSPIKFGGEEYAEQLLPLVRDTVLPAYRAFSDFLRGPYLGKAPAEVGIAAITDGKAFYEQRVRYFTTDDVSPKEVFETGKREVARIRQEMQEIIDDLEFEGSFADFLEFLRTDEQFYAKTGEELLKQAAWITKRMEGKLPEYFDRLPRMPLTVTPVPDALAPNYTGGRYSPGSYRSNRAGQYWVNTYNLSSRPLYVLPALSVHEGVPGHHTQMMLAAEMENVPGFRRGMYLSAFGEGWALYCEYLAKEAGIYQTPYEDFGRLTYEMWRACRLVVDPGMHYFGWTREEAVKFLAENTALSLHEVNTEIDRYIGWPGQAVSYKMGELKIRELRARAEEALGDQFNIREFHDLILENGAITMNKMEQLVADYIAEKKG